MSKFKNRLHSNIDELKREVRKQEIIILLGPIIFSSFVDYIGTGFGSGWDVQTIMQREFTSTLKECVSSFAPSSSDFCVITWCIVTGKIWFIGLISVFFIILALLLPKQIQAGRPAVYFFVFWISIWFSLGGLSWYYPICGKLNYIMREYLILPVCIMFIQWIIMRFYLTEKSSG